MRADRDDQRQFYSHLRDAYEALEDGNRAAAENSILAASEIDPYALAAVEWWNYIRAESVLTDAASEAEVSAIVADFEPQTALVQRVNDEPAAPVYSARPWAKVIWDASAVFAGLGQMMRAVSFTFSAATISAFALLGAFLILLPPFLRSLPNPTTPLARVEEIAPTADAPLPGVTQELAADHAEEAAPQWLSPQLERLGVSPRWRAAAIGLNDRRLLSELQQSVGELWIGRAVKGEHDAIILGVTDVSGLAQLSLLEPSLKSGGVLWVLHPVNDPTFTKKMIQAAARDANLKYLTSTRLSSTQVAEKFVRQRAPRSRT